MTGLLDFSGKTVVITGAAAGIGAATTQLLLDAGAAVHALDIASVEAAVTAAHECDLGDEASIDAVVSRLPSKIDGLFNCAGVPNGGRFTTDEVMAINWLGLRHLTEALLPRINAGGSVVHVASTAGRGWPENLTEITELLAAESFDAGRDWVSQRHELLGDGYAFSKQMVQYYTMARALQTLADGVRMNSICPGVTNTQIAGDFRRGVGAAVIDRAAEIAGRLAEPHEMAPAMLFLADEPSASYVNGINLNVDRGTGAAHLTGSF